MRLSGGRNLRPYRTRYYSRPICMDEIIEGVVSAALRRAIVACTDGSVWQNSLRSL
jgi:hypothetical protein